MVGPDKGTGGKIVMNGKVVGFEVIGQKFDEDRYFNGRPSAVDYDAASTGGSNRGPTNADYLAQVQARIDAFMVHNPNVRKEDIPVDLVTASGGGLDPHISAQAARVQVDRIAGVRNVSRNKIDSLVNAHIDPPLLGFLGMKRVHVLRLNMALDQLK